MLLGAGMFGTNVASGEADDTVIARSSRSHRLGPHGREGHALHRRAPAPSWTPNRRPS